MKILFVLAFVCLTLINVAVAQRFDIHIGPARHHEHWHHEHDGYYHYHEHQVWVEGHWEGRYWIEGHWEEGW